MAAWGKRRKFHQTFGKILKIAFFRGLNSKNPSGPPHTNFGENPTLSLMLRVKLCPNQLSESLDIGFMFY